MLQHIEDYVIVAEDKCAMVVVSYMVNYFHEKSIFAGESSNAPNCEIVMIWRFMKIVIKGVRYFPILGVLLIITAIPIIVVLLNGIQCIRFLYILDVHCINR